MKVTINTRDIPEGKHLDVYIDMTREEHLALQTMVRASGFQQEEWFSILLKRELRPALDKP